MTSNRTAAQPRPATRPARRRATSAASPARARRGPRRPAVTREELASMKAEELWRRYKETGDPLLKQEIVVRHQPLVRYVAERLCMNLPPSVEVDDLIQDGNFGLMDAIEKFDLERGIKFKTYCSSRIRGAILDALRTQDWVPRLVRQRAARLERIQRQWLSRYGREPSQAELAEALAVGETELGRELAKATPRAILNVSDRRLPAGDGGETPLEVIAESRERNPAEAILGRDMMEELTRSLTPKERTILYLYYREGLTLREIGEHLSLTESRVCQIHSNIITRLRERLASRRDQYRG